MSDFVPKTGGAFTGKIYDVYGDEIKGGGAAGVTGPATNTANYVPQWNGANSKTLSNGLGVGTSANNLVQLDGSAKLPAIDGSNLTNLSAAPTASPTFTGTVTLPTTALGEASFQLDPAISADGKWSGISETGTAGATLTFGQLCYYNTSNKWVLAKADSVTTSGGLKLGICVLAAAGNNSATEMLLYGKVNAAAQFPDLTIGAPVYISGASAGAVVTAQPTTTDHVIRVVGYGNTIDELFFNPSQNFITHT